MRVNVRPMPMATHTADMIKIAFYLTKCKLNGNQRDNYLEHKQKKPLIGDIAAGNHITNPTQENSILTGPLFCLLRGNVSIRKTYTFATYTFIKKLDLSFLSGCSAISTG